MPVANIHIDKKVFNNVFIPYLETNFRYEVYYGGAGSGKSVFIAQSYVYRILKHKMLNLLVVRQTGDTNRDSTFALFKQVLNKWNMIQYFKINESDMRITCKLNGNAMIFKGLDDVEKLKSITFAKGELTDVWIEEASEVLEDSFKQLDVRLRGGNTHKQLRISFNPVNVNHWLKRFIDKKQPNKMDMHSTYKDNKFLDDDYKQLLEAYKTTDLYYYTVYCLGGWGVIGKTIFDAAKVSQRLSDIKGYKPFKVGQFTYEYVNQMIVDNSIKWVEDIDGYIRIYEDAKVGYPYVLAGDTSGDGSDNFTGQLIDNTTGKQVCTLKQQFDEDLYTKQMYCLGKYYNNALIGIESNFTTYPIQELQRLGYPTQYIRETEDSITHNFKKSFGFRTTSLTRPLVIAGLVQIVREDAALFNDEDTLNEMLTFVRNEKGRAEAQLGSHDDLIMAMAIVYYIREQQSMRVSVQHTQTRVKLIDKLKPKTIIRM